MLRLDSICACACGFLALGESAAVIRRATDVPQDIES
jgi:hypothetical protein